ncbi:MAG: hypothetical protein ACYC5A_10740, partial [Thermoleophilia bacterium]
PALLQRDAQYFVSQLLIDQQSNTFSCRLTREKTQPDNTIPSRPPGKAAEARPANAATSPVDTFYGSFLRLFWGFSSSFIQLTSFGAN